MKQEEQFYLAALAACPGIGCHTLQKLLEKEPSPRKIWETPADVLVEDKLLSENLAQKLVSFRKGDTNLPDKLFASCEEEGIKLCSSLDEDYPPLLAQIYDAPVLFFYKGTLEPMAERIAMVGARRKTAYGEGIAKSFARDFARAGLTVVSGAARGIDTCAHLGAIEGGRTVAVLGCGLDIAYPPENLRLLQTIVERGGAVISEFVPGTLPYAGNFPARNRIISGLSRGTLVVEASKKSGSLITARMALNEGREVFAIPGTIYSEVSKGCNLLIQQSGAKLVMEVKDVLTELRENGVAVEAQVKPAVKKELHLSQEEQQVYDVLSFHQYTTVDDILEKILELDASKLSLILLQLKIKGLIIENDSHAYRRAEGE